jgi:uncharacterized membrane protein
VAGILTATDPLFTAVLALWLIRSEAVDRKRFAGLVIGFTGVIALLGFDLRGNLAELLGAGAVLLSALGYAAAALLYRRWLADVPALEVTALMTAMSSVAFLVPAAVNLPRQAPPAVGVLAVVALGIVNTGLAYWLFYLLIDQAGAASASVITYVMPVVALFLGVGLLGEQLTFGAIAGLILIALGAWLATAGRRPRRPSRSPQSEDNRAGQADRRGEPPGDDRTGVPGSGTPVVKAATRSSVAMPRAVPSWAAVLMIPEAVLRALTVTLVPSPVAATEDRPMPAWKTSCTPRARMRSSPSSATPTSWAGPGWPRTSGTASSTRTAAASRYPTCTSLTAACCPRRAAPTPP